MMWQQFNKFFHNIYVYLYKQIWIHVARIPVLTPELVYILMMDLFVIVQWGLRERTVKVCTFFVITVSRIKSIATQTFGRTAII